MANTTENEVGLEEHDTTEEMETEFNNKEVNNNIPELIEIGDSLDDITPNTILIDIAKTNQVNTPWQELQTILKDLIKKQCEVMQDKVQNEDVRNTVDTVKTNIIHIIEEHTNCPFTIQRLCELVNEPKKNYRMYIKYLRAVEKVLMVTSYWEDFVDIYNETSAEDKTQSGDRLLPSFVTGMELEPHNFDLPSSEQTEAAVQEEDEDIENNNESGLAEKEHDEEKEKEGEKETEEKETKAYDFEKIDTKNSKMELDQKEDEL
ncbi:hypothetical protein K501DRAFT_338766 [Backusella circina FSU 941]|nr:hypothetical protein K501DRAFT_338766 [Backusella circina FSU 941]